MENSLGDKIGFFQGNNNIVGKDIQVFINEVYSQCGLRLLHPNHFTDNSNITENFEKWKEGFPLSLESVYQKKTFRRDKVINRIKNELEKYKRLIILGESGTSKSTMLMEIICDYFDNNYKVIYNLGDDELKNTNEIVEKVKGLAYADNQILVVVDNVHSPKMSSIFSVINNIQPFKADKKDKIRFLLSARLPEFDWVLERNFLDDSNLVQKIEELFDDSHRYVVPYFTEDETQAFINTYIEFLDISKRNKSIEENTKEIFADTKGYPIMVRFSVLNKGLRSHVKQMYQDHLLSKAEINLQRLTIVVINSLFDISSIPLREDTLKNLGLQSTAFDMQDTIIKRSEGIWRTIHPKWDLEMFRHVFSLKYNSENIINAFSKTIEGVMINRGIDNREKLFMLNAIYYTLTNEKIAKLEDIERIVDLSIVDKYLDNNSKLLLYATIIGFSYYDLGRIKEALLFYEKALEIDQNYVYALNNKGLCFSRIGRYDDAIIEYDKALAINPNASMAHYNKGLSLWQIGKYDDAIIEYDKALAINPNYVHAHYNKGIYLSQNGEYDDAIIEYDKALTVEPNHTETLLGKAASLIAIKKSIEARIILKKVFEIEPENSTASKLSDLLENNES